MPLFPFPHSAIGLPCTPGLPPVVHVHLPDTPLVLAHHPSASWGGGGAPRGASALCHTGRSASSWASASARPAHRLAACTFCSPLPLRL
eukprot:scaffold27248_cov133-Isochrysis_galbana.AAC.4